MINFSLQTTFHRNSSESSNLNKFGLQSPCLEIQFPGCLTQEVGTFAFPANPRLNGCRRDQILMIF